MPQQRLDWTGLTNLSTGVAVVSAAQTAGATGAIAFNGLSPESMGITVDGTNASSDPEEPAFGFYQQPNIINTLNSDAIAEVSVVKGIIPASVSGTISGNVNLITKSGSNQFHGDVFELNDVSYYDARNQFLTTRPRSTFNQYGGSIGGPILRNKLFFFGSYEGVQSTAFQAISGSVPSPYLISVSPKLWAPIFAVFPSAPQPAGNATALTSLYSGTGSLSQKDGNTAERIDYYLSATNQISFRYTRSAPDKTSPRIVAINPRVTDATTNMYNGSYTHSGGNWTSSTRYGYNRLYMFRVDNGFDTGLPGVSFSGFGTSGAEYYVLNGATHTFIQDFALNRGKHSLEFGGVFQRQSTGRIDENTANFSYSTLSDFQSNIPNSVSITFDVPPSELHMYQFGGYIQDTYKLTSNLTLNLGIRYDYFTVPKERDGRLFNRDIDPSRPQLGIGFGPYRPSDSIYNADYKGIQPRVGFAWTIGQDRKTVIRGGSGTFVSPRPMFAGPVTEMQASGNVPFRATLSRPQNLAAGLGYPIDRSAFIPTLTALQASGVLSSQIASNTTIDPNYPNPQSIQWMLAIERELGRGMALSVSYVGNRGLNMITNETINLPNRLTGVAPDPTFAVFVLNRPLDASHYNSLQTSLTKRFAKGFMFGTHFTWASNMSYGAADVVGGAKPQDNNNIRAELGPTPISIRKAFNANFLYELPFSAWIHHDVHAMRPLLGGWQVAGIFTGNDGLPFNITNGNSSYPADRPDVIAGINPLLSDYSSTLRYINPAAFLSIPNVAASGAQARPGNLGRNGLYGPGLWNWDASLSKNFVFVERYRLRMRMDAFNAFNHTSLGGLTTNIASSSFGRLTSATSRDVHISARFDF